jgi:acetylornithine deacetylase
VEGDKLYGHGISNMKASCTAMAAALCALKRSGVELQGDVIASLVMGECDGGLGARHMLKEGLRADYFVNGEPTDLQVLLIHAGVCELRIVVKGRSGHFGIVDKGVNTIEKTMKIMAALGKSMAPMGEDGWLKLRKRSPAYEGYPQFNLGAIKGGLTEECTDTGVYNTPDCCIASLNVRYPPGLTPELVKQDMEAALRTLAAEDPDIDATVELDAQFLLPPYESQPDDHVVRVVRDACADVRGAAPTVGALQPMKFMGADSGQIQEAGIPGVMFGVGTFTSSVADEYVELSKVIDLTKIYAVMASRIASSERAP